MINMLFSQYNFHESWAKDTVAKYINTNDKILIIPFSFDNKISDCQDWENAYSRDKGKFYKSIFTPFMDFGVREENINWINYFKDTKEEAKGKIRNSNIIFFTGGFPEKSMERLKEFDLIEEIRNFSGVIIGSSAGAMIQIAEYHITPDEDYQIFSYNEGLNLIKSFDIEVHYEGNEVQKCYINKVLNEKTDTVYAITDTGGIIVDLQKVVLLGDTRKFSRQ
ncbi:Type 1 glutamine amidotransferase-like domain-containing protein [Peribacillus muralis]|uniref:Type 1 glutamine amidotransferase-like domain-containing protein n=1 Tax=Peribacillus muralis TaxID=264697 RepID=UPI00366CCA12